MANPSAVMDSQTSPNPKRNSTPAPLAQQSDQSAARSGQEGRGRRDGARARTAASQGCNGGSRGGMGHRRLVVFAGCEAAAAVGEGSGGRGCWAIRISWEPFV
jgi:hypothetical protein